MKELFTFPSYEPLAQKLNMPRGEFSLERFSNQEFHLTLNSSVIDKECVILGTLSPPEANLFSYFILTHTLKKEGAKKCIALLPYLAYTRHEHPETNKSQITALLASLVRTSGVDKIITVDIHSELAKELFTIPLISLSPAQLFADELKKIAFIPDTLIAPDKGARQRCQDVASALRLTSAIAYVEKRRTNGVLHFDLIGTVGKKVVLVDDILDTGKTLISSVKKLLSEGPKEIIIMVTHGLFTGSEWHDLKTLGVRKLYCSDTIPLRKELIQDPFISLIPITTLLQESLCNL